MGVMCCELWIDLVGYVKQFVCIGDIVDVCCSFGCEYREVIEFYNLCVFDFCVLIGVFYQMYYDFVVQVGCEFIEVIQCIGGVFVIGLYYNVKVVLFFECWICQNCFDYIYRQRQMVCFFGINIEIYVC